MSSEEHDPALHAAAMLPIFILLVAFMAVALTALIGYAAVVDRVGMMIYRFTGRPVLSLFAASFGILAALWVAKAGIMRLIGGQANNGN